MLSLPQFPISKLVVEKPDSPINRWKIVTNIDSGNIMWWHIIMLCGVPLVCVYSILAVPLYWPTLIWSILYYFITGLGITAGYHRLFSHRSFEATRTLEILLLLAGSGALEGSVLWWARDHRAHHRYTDTKFDPYNSRRGLFYSHIGWLFWKPKVEDIGPVDTSDLSSNHLLRLQHEYCEFLFLLMGFILPAAVAGIFWNDWRGGLFFAGFVRLFFVQQATFCVNSLAHWLGEATFDDRHTPRDHIITALLTLGEGYHNFHHEFPYDYRNAIGYFQYDPTKWLINALSWTGMAYNLKESSKNENKKAQACIKEKQLNELKGSINWGPTLSQLPSFTIEQFEREISKNEKQWIIINNVICDIEKWQHEHPGGKMILKKLIGKDVTKAFEGGVYDHSNSAHRHLNNLCIGVIRSSEIQNPT